MTADTEQEARTTAAHVCGIVNGLALHPAITRVDVIATIATDLVDFYIVDIWRQRVQYPELGRAAIERYEMFRPLMVYCEEAASGFAVVQELKASTSIPVVGIEPVESKEARAEAVLPLFESGRVKIRANASWTDDDQVDAVNLGLTQLWEAARLYNTRRRQRNIFPWKDR